MSRGVNKVILVGHLGSDPELRFTPSGKAVANVSLATSEQWTDGSGERKEHTEWHRLQFWGRLAEVVGEYLKKGAQIYVEGKIRTRKWEDKQGVARYTTEIIVQDLQMLGGKGDGQPRQQQASAEDYRRAKEGRGVAAPSAQASADFDDSIPF